MSMEGTGERGNDINSPKEQVLVENELILPRNFCGKLSNENEGENLLKRSQNNLIKKYFKKTYGRVTSNNEDNLVKTRSTTKYKKNTLPSIDKFKTKPTNKNNKSNTNKLGSVAMNYKPSSTFRKPTLAVLESLITQRLSVNDNTDCSNTDIYTYQNNDLKYTIDKLTGQVSCENVINKNAGAVPLDMKEMETNQPINMIYKSVNSVTRNICSAPLRRKGCLILRHLNVSNSQRKRDFGHCIISTKSGSFILKRHFKKENKRPILLPVNSQGSRWSLQHYIVFSSANSRIEKAYLSTLRAFFPSTYNCDGSAVSVINHTATFIQELEKELKVRFENFLIQHNRANEFKEIVHPKDFEDCMQISPSISQTNIMSVHDTFEHSFDERMCDTLVDMKPSQDNVSLTSSFKAAVENTVGNKYNDLHEGHLWEASQPYSCYNISKQHELYSSDALKPACSTASDVSRMYGNKTIKEVLNECNPYDSMSFSLNSMLDNQFNSSQENIDMFCGLMHVASHEDAITATLSDSQPIETTTQHISVGDEGYMSQESNVVNVKEDIGSDCKAITTCGAVLSPVSDFEKEHPTYAECLRNKPLFPRHNYIDDVDHTGNYQQNDWINFTNNCCVDKTDSKASQISTNKQFVYTDVNLNSVSKLKTPSKSAITNQENVNCHGSESNLFMNFSP